MSNQLWRWDLITWYCSSSLLCSGKGTKQSRELFRDGINDSQKCWPMSKGAFFPDPPRKLWTAGSLGADFPFFTFWQLMLSRHCFCFPRRANEKPRLTKPLAKWYSLRHSSRLTNNLSTSTAHFCFSRGTQAASCNSFVMLQTTMGTMLQLTYLSELFRESLLPARTAVMEGREKNLLFWETVFLELSQDFGFLSCRILNTRDSPF